MTKGSPPSTPDNGDADPYLVRALQSFAADPLLSLPEMYTALLDAQVLVPVVARLLERDETTGADKRSEMQLLTLRSGDREALVVFSGWPEMQAWRTDVRPVPISAQDAAGIAIENEYDALVIDVAGPVSFVLEGDPLVAIAEGYQPVTGVNGVSAKSSVEVDIRRASTLPAFAADAVEDLKLEVIPLEIQEGDGAWRPAIGIVATPENPIAVVAAKLAEHLTEAIDMVPLTPLQAATLPPRIGAG